MAAMMMLAMMPSPGAAKGVVPKNGIGIAFWIAGVPGMADMVKKSKTPDVAFVQGMLPHHASAIDMANLALQQGQDARVLSLAKTIITAQAKEMLDYRTWLKKRGL